VPKAVMPSFGGDCYRGIVSQAAGLFRGGAYTEQCVRPNIDVMAAHTARITTLTCKKGSRNGRLA